MQRRATPHGAAPVRSDHRPRPAGPSLRLRLARQMRGLTLKELAAAVGCSESMLSKAETGKTSPSPAMMHRLVSALGTDIGWMTEPTRREDGIVSRAGERPPVARDPSPRGDGISVERVIPTAAGHLLGCDIQHIAVGGGEPEPMRHAGEEVGYVLRGRVELILDGRTFRLDEGDSCVFSSDLPHRYRNAGDGPASVLRVTTPATV